MMKITYQMIYKKKYISLVFIIGYFISFCNAQTSTLSDYQLLKFQASPLNEIKTFLKNEKWSDRTKDGQSIFHFGFNLEYNIENFKKNGDQLIVYHYPKKQNIIIYQLSADSFNAFLKQMNSSKGGTRKSHENYNSTLFNDSNITTEFRVYIAENSIKKYSIVVSNLNVLNKEIKKAEDIELAKIKFAKDQEEKYKTAIAEGDKLFEQEMFLESISEYEVAEKLFPNRTEMQEKIAISKNSLSKQIIAIGDVQYSNAKYNEAIESYQNALKIGLNTKIINDKIDDARSKIKEVKIKNLLSEASLLFIADKYNESLVIYKEVNKLNANNTVANDRIKEINKINNILADREHKVYKYSEINSSIFKDLISNLENEFNGAIEKNKAGQIKLEYEIQYDKYGTNNSNLISNKSNIKRVDQFLSSFDFNSTLTPSKIGKFYVASRERINVDLNWRTSKVTYKSNFKEMKTSDLSKVGENVFKNYINDQSFRYGNYTFEVVNKKNNYDEFTDIRLINYSVAGPESAFLSMLVPGLGTLNVTQGKKGWGRLGLFLVTAGASVVANILSDKEYQKYIDSQDRIESEALYKKADDLHKISLISGGLAATIYVHDIIWVISKGNQNLKKSKYLRDQVNEKPVEILKQKIKL